MIDFLLNADNDFSLEPSKKHTPFVWQFTCGPTFRFQFDIGKDYRPRTQAGFRWQFYTEPKPDTRQKVPGVTGNQELAQNIKIVLQTELGEIPGQTEFGSLLAQYKHAELGSEQNLENIEAVVTEIAGGILNKDITVQAIVEPSWDAGYFYRNNISIYIYADGTEFCRFVL